MKNEKLHKQLIFVALLIFSNCFMAFSQDIYVKVKKGTAKIKGKTKLTSDAAFTIGSKDTVFVTSGSLAIARKGTIVVELSSNKRHTYKAISTMISKKKASTNGDFSDVVFNDKIQKPSGKVYGSSTRGSGERTPDHAAPDDRVTVIGDTFNIEFGNDWTTPSSKLLIINTQTQDTTAAFTLENDEHNKVVSNLTEGEYKWLVTLKYREEMKTVYIQLEKHFIIPTKEFQEKALYEYLMFKEECAGFSEELGNELLGEFLYFKNWEPGTY
jgi:hypothetical protein